MKLENIIKKVNFKSMFIALSLMIMNLKFALADEISIPEEYTIQTDIPRPTTSGIPAPIVEPNVGMIVALCIVGVVVAICFVAGIIFLVRKGIKNND